MARIRDILRRAESPRQAATLHSHAEPRPASNLHIAVPPEDEVPFIEVGAPNGVVEASSSVKASAPAPSRSPAISLASPMPVSAKIPEPARAKQPGFSFRALPPAPVPLSPTAQRLARELIVYHEPEHELSAAYGSLAAAIAAQLPEARAHILLFAKASQELSGGAMVLNLALARVAEVPGRVVVVDANLRSPDTAKLLGLTAAPGLHEVLAGSIALRRAVRESGCEGVDILTAGDPAGDTAGLLAGQAMQAALRHLRNDYRWVLVSAPHWDGRPDIVALAGACDVVYLYTTSDDDELKQIIPRQGGALRGCIILND